MNKNIHAVIIEDEIPAARLLCRMLQELRPNWIIEILPGTVEESVEWFATHQHPDILFLDIQLNDGISFQFIEQSHPKSLIVFTTAYDEFAIRAFTINSIDYLLKPIAKERLEETLSRCEHLIELQLHKDAQLENLELMIQSLATKQEPKYRTRFLIAAYNHFYTIAVSDIAYFYSEEKITYLVTQNGKEHIIDFPLNKLEEQLDNRNFMRVNRQFILSANCIKTIIPEKGGKVILTVEPVSNKTIVISKERISALKLWLNS